VGRLRVVGGEDFVLDGDGGWRGVIGWVLGFVSWVGEWWWTSGMSGAEGGRSGRGCDGVFVGGGMGEWPGGVGWSGRGSKCLSVGGIVVD